MVIRPLEGRVEAFTRFRVSGDLFTPALYTHPMPRIEVSENLYRQIESEASEDDFNDTLWKMVGSYRRTNNPEADQT